MNRKLLTLWGLAFLLCAGLSLIPSPPALLQGFETVLSLLFFVPGFLLVYRGNRFSALLVRNLAMLSLGLTVVMLIANLAAVTAAPAVGNLLYVMLAILSVPMVASGSWALSLFLWACLMLCAIEKTKKRRK